MSSNLSDRTVFMSIALVALANIVFMLLAMTVWFGGSAEMPGAVDYLFTRIGGFRVDAIWLVVSSLALFFSGIACFIAARDKRGIWSTSLLCFTENAVFLMYLHHVFYAGLVDFG